MRRSSLLALATACVAVTAAAPAASAQTGDSVTGRIQVRTSASTVLDVSFDAHSGPSGEQPSGTVTDNGSGNVGFVQCLNVVGNQAVLIATGNNFTHPDLRRGQRRRITGQVRLRLSLWGPTYVP